MLTADEKFQRNGNMRAESGWTVPYVYRFEHVSGHFVFWVLEEDRIVARERLMGYLDEARIFENPEDEYFDIKQYKLVEDVGW